MAKLRLRANEKRLLSALGTEALELRYDYARRFRNAILSLALSDPKWMIWVGENLPADGNFSMADLLLVESRARALTLKSHGWLGRKYVCDLVFRHDWAFTDRGSLSPG